jgi:hypothetical protein
MHPGGIYFIAFGMVAALAGIFSRSIWSRLAAPMYRSPESVEPSDLRFRIGQVVGVVVGLIFVVLGFALPGPSDPAGSGDATGPAEETSTGGRISCSTLLSAVLDGDTSSEESTRTTVGDVANRFGLEVQEELSEPSSDFSTTTFRVSGAGAEPLVLLWVDGYGQSGLDTDASCP